MHQKSFTQHKHSYMQAEWRKGHLRFGPNLLHANQFQASPNLLQTKRWDPYLCKKEESCKSLFVQVPSNDALYTCQIPLASYESWDFGPKIGLDGLDGLAQVWTPLPPNACWVALVLLWTWLWWPTNLQFQTLKLGRYVQENAQIIIKKSHAQIIIEQSQITRKWTW